MICKNDLKPRMVLYGASLVAQRVKSLPAMWETPVRSLGWENSLEKEMATHSSILAWRIPWTEEPGRLQFTVWQRVRHDWATSLSFFLYSLVRYCFLPESIKGRLKYKIHGMIAWKQKDDWMSSRPNEKFRIHLFESCHITWFNWTDSTRGF